MPLESQSDITVEKVAIGMEELLGHIADDRAQAFKSIQPALTHFLRDMDTKIYDMDAAQAQATARFTQMARIYLRALATYRADTEAWFNVFLAFKQLFDGHLSMMRVWTKAHRLMSPPVSTGEKDDG